MGIFYVFPDNLYYANFRKRSPNRMVTRLITDLDSFTQKWTSPSFSDSGKNSVPVYVIGQDIVRKELEISNRIRTFKDLREQLTAPVFNCCFCVSFIDHVSLIGYGVL